VIYEATNRLKAFTSLNTERDIIFGIYNTKDITADEAQTFIDEHQPTEPDENLKELKEKSLGEIMIYVREREGLSLDLLASMTGMVRRRLEKIEAGVVQAPSDHTINGIFKSGYGFEKAHPRTRLVQDKAGEVRSQRARKAAEKRKNPTLPTLFPQTS